MQQEESSLLVATELTTWRVEVDEEGAATALIAMLRNTTAELAMVGTLNLARLILRVKASLCTSLKDRAI